MPVLGINVLYVPATMSGTQAVLTKYLLNSVESTQVPGKSRLLLRWGPSGQ